MNIVIDGIIFQWQAGRSLGISRLWRNLIPELAEVLQGHSIHLLTRSGFPAGIQGVIEHEIPAYQPGIASVLECDDRLLSRVCAELKADIFLSTYYTRAPGFDNILMTYDMIPEIFGWDLAHPEWLAKQRAIAEAVSYLSISESTKKDLVRLYGIQPERIRVSYCGVSSPFKPANQQEIQHFLGKYAIKLPYFLLVGNRGYYKNSIPFFQAFATLPNQQQLQVLAVGGEPQLQPQEHPFAQAYNVQFIPWLEDDELRMAYSGALALVYPSRYEGFGLPVAEAMASGCPVITSPNASIPEVGGDAPLYVNPDSYPEIVMAMQQVMNPTVRVNMAARGVVQARRFRWRNMAHSTAQAILEMKAGGTSPEQWGESGRNRNGRPKLFISAEIRISENDEAEALLREKNDLCFYSPEKGIVKVDRARWEEAQAYEARTWLINCRSEVEDRNEHHREMFNRFSVLDGKRFERAIELGCGPFTNLRLILEHLQAEQLFLLDPLVQQYLEHPHCTYKDGQLNGHPVQLIASTIEEYEPELPFDLVVLINVLEHCYSAEEVLKRVVSMLKPGGVLIFHDRLYTEGSIDAANQYDAGHPLRIRGEMTLDFLKNHFQPFYRATNNDQLMNLPQIYFIGSRRLEQVYPKRDQSFPLQTLIPASRHVPLVSAIVSTYQSEEFMEECLEDLENQTIADRLEIIVVDANSPQDEDATVEKFQRKYGNIKYIRTERRIGVYAAWNVAIRAAQGQFITTFSTNDRLRKDAYEILLQSLLKNPDVALVYGDTYLTRHPHETFEQHTCSGAYQWPDYSFEDLLQVCLVGPHPMWRRKIHEEIGFFDEKYVAIGDQEFWLQIGERYPLLHVREFTGLYWESPEAISRKGDLPNREIAEIHTKYQRRYIERLQRLVERCAAVNNLDRPRALFMSEFGFLPKTQVGLEVLNRLNSLEAVAGRNEVARIDIVIPVFGQPHLLKRCMDSLFRTAPGARIILVNDASPDATTLGLLQTYSRRPEVTVCHNPQNMGFIGSTRRGAELGSAPFILFLNSDIEATEPGWLEKMIPAEEDVAIVGARLLYPPDLPGPLAGTIQHAGIARRTDGWPFHPYLGQPSNHPVASQSRYLNAVTGACFLIRRRVWNELGGWDDRFGRGVGEDVDLCWQARQHGYRVYYQANATLYHWESASRDTSGNHSLQMHAGENIEKLTNKWSSLRSDEDVFIGKESARKNEQAHFWVHKAQKALDKGDFKTTVKSIRQAVKLAPNLPEALIGYAQILSHRGEHRKAAEYYEKALLENPKHWPVWLRLADEWQAAGDPERAAAVLAQIKPVFPQDPEVLQREARLAGWMPEPENPAPVPQAGRNGSGLKSPPDLAVDTLTLLLEAEDLPAALQTYAGRLDADVLALVRANADSARADGDGELAEGLEDLAEYIVKSVRL